MKLWHDFAAHYNRPDIFHLEVDRVSPQIYTVKEALQHAVLPVEALGLEPTPVLPSANPAQADLPRCGRVLSETEPTVSASGGRGRLLTRLGFEGR